MSSPDPPRSHMAQGNYVDFGAYGDGASPIYLTLDGECTPGV